MLGNRDLIPGRDVPEEEEEYEVAVKEEEGTRGDRKGYPYDEVVQLATRGHDAATDRGYCHQGVCQTDDDLDIALLDEGRVDIRSSEDKEEERYTDTDCDDENPLHERPDDGKQESCLDAYRIFLLHSVIPPSEKWRDDWESAENSPFFFSWNHG